MVIGLALLVMLLALLDVWQLERQTEMAIRSTERSDARLFGSQLLLLRLVDAETGVRGYAATHDRQFLDPYINSVAVMPGLIEGIVADPERVPANTAADDAAIAQGATEQMVLLGQVYHTLEGQDSSAVPAALLRGKVGMDALRNRIDRYQSAERTINAARRARAAGYQADLSYALAGTLLLAIAGGIAGILLFTKRVVGRLAAIIVKTEQVAADQELGAPLRGSDEIVAVDRAVHSMATAIRARSAELAASHAALNERNAELSEANKELESFSYSVSHDLRSPIRAIDGYSRRLGLDFKLETEARRLLGVIQDEAARMGHLIDDLLAFSRLGRQQMRIGSVDMTTLAREVADGANCSGTNVSLGVTMLPHANGDRALLRQVWQNLIENAVKYSGKQVAPVINVTGSTEGPLAVYHVSDNGVGFDMKYAHKLFGVFERLHRADEFPGTGVGLAIVERIIARHGGKAWAYAEPGAGATFSFSLPSGEA